MFKLYFNYNGWEKKGVYGDIKDTSLTLRFFNELQAVQMMKAIADKYHRYYFMLVERLGETDDIKGCIRSEEEMNEYIQEFYERKAKFENPVIEDMSCIDLKREILRGQKL